jgi:hypothetical protein
MPALKNHVRFSINASTNISLLEKRSANDWAKEAENKNTRFRIIKSKNFLKKLIESLLLVT